MNIQMDNILLGIDIGGTTVKIGMVNHEGEIVHKWEIPTTIGNQSHLLVHHIWQSILDQIDSLLMKTTQLRGIGIGAPGFIDHQSGIVHEAVNIGWKNYHLADEFKNVSGLPVFVENDANVAALGENWKGGGKHAKHLIAVTLGTGVGGGIITDGSILSGETGTAGEIGHIIIDRNGYDCNCGRRGCLETISSATGMINQAMDSMKTNPKSKLANLYKDQGNMTTKDIFTLADTGDPLSQKIIDHTADVLGLALANTAIITNPSIILIGGGVSKAGDQFIGLIDTYFKKYALKRVSKYCEVKAAELGNDAGMIGAAYLVKKNSD